MTQLGSELESFGLSITAAEPVLSSRAGRTIGRLTEYAKDFSCTSAALGGYSSAKFSMTGSIDFLDEWFDAGLGRDVTFYGQGNEAIWNGFVNRISYRCGALAATRGPYLDIANRVYMVFSSIDTTTTPPTMGIRLPTTTYNDAASQRDYGILAKVLSTGGASTATADQIVQTYLAEHARPETSLAVADAGSPPEVTLECVGYYNFLSEYAYNVTTTGTQTITAKLTAILAAEPSGIFGAARLATNSLPVSAYEQDDKLAWDLVKHLVAIGDTSENRYLFGVYEGRVPLYAVAPTAVAYQQRLRDPSLRITTGSEAVVHPWEVKAGRWMFYPDFLIGRTIPDPGDLRLDPRASFLETVTFTAPYSVTWSGNRMSRLDQKLARLGLSGIGG